MSDSQFDEKTLERLAELASKIDGARPGDWEDWLAEFNRIAGTNLSFQEFQGIYGGYEYIDWVRQSVLNQIHTPPLTDENLRETLLALANDLQNYDLPSVEYAILVKKWNTLCPHPGGSDIIFWPNILGLCDEEEIGSFEMTPDEIASFAVSWQPRVVSMEVSKRTGGPNIGYYEFRLTAPDTPTTFFRSDLESDYATGMTLAVALKGIVLADGSTVKDCHVFGQCDHPAGTILSIEDVTTGL